MSTLWLATSVIIYKRMIREEANEDQPAPETSPKETLYIRNINEKIKPKGT